MASEITGRFRQGPVIGQFDLSVDIMVFVLLLVFFYIQLSTSQTWLHQHSLIETNTEENALVAQPVDN